MFIDISNLSFKTKNLCIIYLANQYVIALGNYQSNLSKPRMFLKLGVCMNSDGSRTKDPFVTCIFGDNRQEV